jgi:hypothetical protein
VIEREMDDTVLSGGAVLESIRIGDRPAIHFGARGGEGGGLVVGSAEANHLMACRDQIRDDFRADIASSTSHKYAHEKSLQLS